MEAPEARRPAPALADPVQTQQTQADSDAVADSAAGEIPRKSTSWAGVSAVADVADADDNTPAEASVPFPRIARGSTLTGATAEAMWKQFERDAQRKGRTAGSLEEQVQIKTRFDLCTGAARPRKRSLCSSGRPDKNSDKKSLPKDLIRIYTKLEDKHGEDYALRMVFLIRTAIELHRAWHMTLLTNKILQQLKRKFKLRVNWTLGVIKLHFSIEDGAYELHRNVPYDYDSEFQDLYMKTAVALIEGEIDVHQALQFQTDMKEGRHSARIGYFMRDLPGRIVLYPLEAATCAVIFFGGDWTDGGVAAVCGLSAGLVEFGLSKVGRVGGVLLDVLVGVSTGIIGGLVYRYDGEDRCLSAIFLGTLYWFFYGTAFVIGLLEIIAGELETGVTRFIAVSVKTFVLCLGTALGMMMTLPAVHDAWTGSDANCNRIDLDEKWWRIPLYLLCSASALGQYRFPIVDYWRGLIVQLAGYEVQYRLLVYFNDEHLHLRDNMDIAAANVAGAMAAVATACALTMTIDKARYLYYARLLERGDGEMQMGDCLFNFMTCCVRGSDWLRLGRESDSRKLDLTRRLKEHRESQEKGARSKIELNPLEEKDYAEIKVGAQGLNIWALLMPAVYQLVPGAMIAKMWFNMIFPPPLVSRVQRGPNGTSIRGLVDEGDDIFSNLMIISTSLALGLILGFALVLTVLRLASCVLPKPAASGPGDQKRQSIASGVSAASSSEQLKVDERKQARLGVLSRLAGMFAGLTNDPDDVPEDNLSDAETETETDDEVELAATSEPDCTAHPASATLSAYGMDIEISATQAERRPSRRSQQTEV